MPLVRGGRNQAPPVNEPDEQSRQNVLDQLRARFASTSPDFAAVIDRLPAEADASGHQTWLATSASSSIIGKTCTRRLHARIGYFRVPTPRLRTVFLNGVTGIRVDNRTSADDLTAGISDSLQTGQLDCCMINRLRDDTPLGQSVLKRAKLHHTVHRSAVAWQCDLIDMNGNKAFPLKGKTRRKRRNECRRLANALGPVSVDIVTGASGIDLFLEAAEQITAASYHASLGVGVRSSPLWRNIMLAEAVNQRLRCYLLHADSRVVAYVFGVVDNHGVYHFEATSFDPAYREHSPGSVLLWHVINDLFATQTAARIDFGFGDAAYKRAYATRQVQESTVQIFGRSARAHCAAAMIQGANLLHDRCASAPLAATVKRLWRRQMTTRAHGARR